jgi:predicted RNase H-like HicB family nuclease
MPKSSEEYLKEPYSRILIPDENGFFSAEIMEFPGCFAEGKTADEAMHNLEEAAKSWIEASLEQGHEIPEPFMNQGFGGKIALRLPRSLHRQAVRMAERDGISLNQFLVSAIAARIGSEDFYSHLIEELKHRMENKLVYIIPPMLSIWDRAASLSVGSYNISREVHFTKSIARTNEKLELMRNA